MIRRLFTNPWVWMALYVLLTTAVLLAGFRHWRYDDPYIIYRYAENLAGGHGLVYNLGERVWSSTTLLMVLIMAGASALDLPLPTTAVGVGVLCLALGGVCLWDLAHQWRAPWVGWLGLLLYPSFPQLVSTLSSEVPLYLALCLAAFAAFARRRWTLSAAFCGLAVLTRPDAVIVAVLLGGAAVWQASPRARFSAALAWWPLPALLLPWAAFASIYFGSPIPLSLSAKQAQAGLSLSMSFAQGFGRVLAPYAAAPGYWLLAAGLPLGMAAALKRYRPWLLLLAWPLLYTLAYISLGVTYYPWYYAPLVILLIVSTALAFQYLSDSLLTRRSLLAIRLPLLIILCLLPALSQISMLRPAWHMQSARMEVYRQVGQWLKQNADPDAQVAALEIGAIGYYSRRPMIDFAGLLQKDSHDALALGSYDAAAVEILKKYPPDYIVLIDFAFPQLEQSELMKTCQGVLYFPPGKYEFGVKLVSCPAPSPAAHP